MTDDHQYDENEATADVRAEHDGGAAVPGAPLGELLQVDPRQLIIGANVRGTVVLDREFVRSIRDRGVREPIQVRRRADGALVVRKGKRRTLGAIEAGQALVRVLVDPEVDPAEEDGAGQIERIEHPASGQCGHARRAPRCAWAARRDLPPHRRGAVGPALSRGRTSPWMAHRGDRARREQRQFPARDDPQLQRLAPDR
ncbi:ParB N-terminal domain-containing protein [Pseudonocardia xinjiangensis]|uniref:ParB N-terminal domain-containing protein n=2 Tax=Pseudonocardia xinjiangensis TaxID=75289 RepID=A0ABX1RE20_9PSEU|nr:ParB N-terminal domain-containing protein [Pseudonocardia xinjiangensis]NMH78645.1 ParB N-terminal domain-containing protein [Pseudonocardia xinjiangensis]